MQTPTFTVPFCLLLREVMFTITSQCSFLVKKLTISFKVWQTLVLRALHAEQPKHFVVTDAAPSSGESI